MRLKSIPGLKIATHLSKNAFTWPLEGQGHPNTTRHESQTQEHMCLLKQRPSPPRPISRMHSSADWPRRCSASLFARLHTSRPDKGRESG